MDLHALLELLESPDPPSHPREEEALLEELATRYAECYDFASRPDGLLLGAVLRALLGRRLLSDEWLLSVPADHKLRVIQCARIILRDARYEDDFLALGGPQVVARVFAEASHHHFGPEPSRFNAELLSECASIIKKLASGETTRSVLVSCNVHATLVFLLSTSDASLLPSLLVALIGLAGSPECSRLICSLDCPEKLLRILEDYELLFKVHGSCCDGSRLGVACLFLFS